MPLEKPYGGSALHEVAEKQLSGISPTELLDMDALYNISAPLICLMAN